MAHPMTNHIVFVDARVPDYHQLMSGLPDGIELILLDANRDGVAQIVDALQGKSHLDAVDILSTSVSETVYLGTSILNSQGLARYAVQLKKIGQAMSAHGDILLHACDRATGEIEPLLISQLAKATGTEAAATSHVSGACSKSSDWLLEIAICRQWLRYQRDRAYRYG